MAGVAARPSVSGHRLPPARAGSAVAGLPRSCPSRYEHRIAADHHAIGAATSRGRAPAPPRRPSRRPVRRSPHRGGGRSQRADHGVLVDARDDDQRVDPGLAQHRAAGRSRPNAAPPGSSPHVRPLQQGHALPAEDRVAQLVDRVTPQVHFLLPRLGRRARRAAEHGDQRRQLLVGRLALDDLDVRLVLCSASSPAAAWSVTATSSLTSADCSLGSLLLNCSLGSLAGSCGSLLLVVAHSGMLPCFFGGIWAILRSSSRSAVAT